MTAWKKLKENCDNCKKCSLHKNRKQAVLGDGWKESPLMFVGEGPGKNEDVEGIPFTGKAGILLDKCLERAILPRDSVYITNIVKCRPHEINPATGYDRNRQPTQEEIDACNEHLITQVKLVKPYFILCIGSPAAKTVIRPDFSITKERGLLFNSVFNIPSMACLHPAYILRQDEPMYSSLLDQLVEDLRLAKKETRKIAQERGLDR